MIHGTLHAILQVAPATGVLADDEKLLKLLASVVALVISAVGVNFGAADFINKARDAFPKRADGIRHTLSALYHWGWGYSVAIAANFLFFKIVQLVTDQFIDPELDSELVWMATGVYWDFLVNVLVWVRGAFLDFKIIWSSTRSGE